MRNLSLILRVLQTMVAFWILWTFFSNLTDLRDQLDTPVPGSVEGAPAEPAPFRTQKLLEYWWSHGLIYLSCAAALFIPFHLLRRFSVWISALMYLGISFAALIWVMVRDLQKLSVAGPNAVPPSVLLELILYAVGAVVLVAILVIERNYLPPKEAIPRRHSSRRKMNR